MADQVVQDIKDRVDVVELIGSYLPLKRAGVNWKANCPFHNEKSPSFNVSPPRQIWHCFGCGEGGDIFTFVQKFEHLDFPETLKLLADRAGIVLPERSQVDHARLDQKEKAFRIHAFVSKYYHAVLLSSVGTKANMYLQGRGLTLETMKIWEIGYAPPVFSSLSKVLAKKDVSLAELVASGLVVNADKGRVYDRFYGRVTFPICDFRGRVVGFSARLLEDRPNAAKYVNSSESEIYKKSEILFGLDKAKSPITKLGEVVVVEGQMDCIKAHQAGFQNTVASSGTALTEQQLKLIKRLTDRVSFAFDTDSAGEQALFRATVLALQMGLDVKVINYTGAKDPDELISQDVSLWQTAVATALPVIDYYIRKAQTAFPPQSLAQRRFVAEMVLPLLKALQSEIDKDHYLQLLSRSFGLAVASLREDLRKVAISTSTHASLEPKSQNSTALVASVSSNYRGLEQIMLGSLKYPEVAELFSLETISSFFTDPQYRILAELILTKQTIPDDLKIVLQEAEFVVESLSDEYDGDETKLIAELLRIFDTFRLAGLKQQQENLTQQLQVAEVAKDAGLIETLKREFAKLIEQRLKFERKTENTTK